ncbi:hypothetical protein [Sandaracinus amylolyticus]|uniref:hypothetical protein n=1 Tax=Sandaracinus amylolyticus TaxID=927083 RepID=UPI00069D3AD1|nr:hypothetical protein [Sandaracinus amylolyticus]
MGVTARIDSGSVLLFRFLDVADELDLDRAPMLLESRATVRRVSIRRESSVALALETLPVELDLGPRTITLGDGTELAVTARLRLFRFGVVAVVLEVPIAPGTALEDLVPLAASTWEASAIDDAARAIARELAEPLVALANEPLTELPQIERYAVVFVRAITGDPLARPEIVARLLLGESDPRPVSQAACEHVLAHRFQYYVDDLAIVHATSALVIEPSDDRDVVLALELACSQLLEFRVYDAIIDRELDRVYDELGHATKRGWWIFGRAHEALSRRAQLHMVELSELADRAESAVRVASDTYLARVYLAALERQHALAWRDSVMRKLRLFAQAYDVLKDEAHARRALAVEYVIVLLIAFEIVMALLER